MTTWLVLHRKRGAQGIFYWDTVVAPDWETAFQSHVDAFQIQALVPATDENLRIAAAYMTLTDARIFATHVKHLRG